MADSVSVTSASDDEQQSSQSQSLKRVKRMPRKDEMRVFLRIRPSEPNEIRGPIGVNEEEKCLRGTSNDEYQNQRIDEFRGLKFNRIFQQNCSQQDFFSEVIAPILPDIFNSKKSGVVFAYGVTNSGKTHSIIGSQAFTHSERLKHEEGILPRVLWFFTEARNRVKQRLSERVDFYADDDLMRGIFGANRFSSEEDITIDGISLDMSKILHHSSNSLLKLSDMQVYFENFEIYNEEIYDLQVPTSQALHSAPLSYDNQRSGSKHNSTSKNKLKIKEQHNKKVFIKGLMTHEIENESQIRGLLRRAIDNRSVRNNNLNNASSRSQCCFKIRVKFTYSHSFHSVEDEASLLILDLAGAERAKKTQNSGTKMTESCHINRTLLCLGNCIRALRNGDENIPYRDSKLTRILNEYFVDSNHVAMIVHIHPGLSYLEENINVLKYAAIGLEAKLKASAAILESGSKSFRHDRSYLSNLSFDQRNQTYRSYQSIDQDQIFAHLENIINDQHMLDPFEMLPTDHNSLQPSRIQLEEKQRQLEEKCRQLELREVIQQQKRAIENFDLQFESMINEERSKLQLGQSLLDQFRIPNEYMIQAINNNNNSTQQPQQLQPFQQNHHLNSVQPTKLTDIINSPSKGAVQEIATQKEKQINQDNELQMNNQQGVAINQLGFMAHEDNNKQTKNQENENSQKNNNNNNTPKELEREIVRISSSIINRHSQKRIFAEDILNPEKNSLSDKPNRLSSSNCIDVTHNIKKSLKKVSINPQQPEASSIQSSQSQTSQQLNAPQPSFSQEIVKTDQRQDENNERSSQNSSRKQILNQQSSPSFLRTTSNGCNDNRMEELEDNSELVTSKPKQMQSISQNCLDDAMIINDSRKESVDQKNNRYSFAGSNRISGNKLDDTLNGGGENADQVDVSNQLLESMRIQEGSDSDEEDVFNETEPFRQSRRTFSTPVQPNYNSAQDSQSRLRSLLAKQDEERKNQLTAFKRQEEELMKSIIPFQNDSAWIAERCVSIKKEIQEKELLLSAAKVEFEKDLANAIQSQSQVVLSNSDPKMSQISVSASGEQDELDYQKNQKIFPIVAELEEKNQQMREFFETQVSNLKAELRLQQKFLEEKEAILEQHQEELTQLQKHLQANHAIEQENSRQARVANECFRNEIEMKLQNETDKFASLSSELQREIAALKEQQNTHSRIQLNSPKQNLSQQKSKTTATAATATTASKHEYDRRMEVEPIEKSLINNETPVKQISSMQNEVVGGAGATRLYAEKMIQTSSQRPCVPLKKNPNFNTTATTTIATTVTPSAQQADVGVYTYYSYSEAEQGLQHSNHIQGGGNNAVKSKVKQDLTQVAIKGLKRLPASPNSQKQVISSQPIKETTEFNIVENEPAIQKEGEKQNEIIILSQDQPETIVTIPSDDDIAVSVVEDEKPKRHRGQKKNQIQKSSNKGSQLDQVLNDEEEKMKGIENIQDLGATSAVVQQNNDSQRRQTRGRSSLKSRESVSSASSDRSASSSASVPRSASNKKNNKKKGGKKQVPITKKTKRGVSSESQISEENSSSDEHSAKQKQKRKPKKH